jgi:hypothetical protein
VYDSVLSDKISGETLLITVFADRFVLYSSLMAYAGLREAFFALSGSNLQALCEYRRVSSSTMIEELTLSFRLF